MAGASVGEMLESLCGACTEGVAQTSRGYCLQGEMVGAGPEKLFVHLVSRLAVLLGSIDAVGLPLSNPYDTKAARLRAEIEKAAGSSLKS